MVLCDYILTNVYEGKSQLKFTDPLNSDVNELWPLSLHYLQLIFLSDRDYLLRIKLAAI